jgi:hypothetical protein
MKGKPTDTTMATQSLGLAEHARVKSRGGFLYRMAQSRLLPGRVEGLV